MCRSGQREKTKTGIKDLLPGFDGRGWARKLQFVAFSMISRLFFPPLPKSSTAATPLPVEARHARIRDDVGTLSPPLPSLTAWDTHCFQKARFQPQKSYTLSGTVIRDKDASDREFTSSPDRGTGLGHASAGDDAVCGIFVETDFLQIVLDYQVANSCYAWGGGGHETRLTRSN
ncbi:hypothetical protein LZ31DRAFT_555059 [Colletotrichum somersetense]|nr:hypothetical protein LZ31DRAFT_555059 [Colletotrichum somersetense]